MGSHAGLTLRDQQILDCLASKKVKPLVWERGVEMGVIYDKIAEILSISPAAARESFYRMRRRYYVASKFVYEYQRRKKIIPEWRRIL